MSVGAALARAAAAACALRLAACASAPVARDDGRAPHPPGTLDVVTLNIYHDAADWPARFSALVDGLRALDPDVIALQEVLQHALLPNQAETIADALGHDWHFVSSDPPGQARRYGNAILTRLPVLDRDAHLLLPRDDARSVALLRIEVDGRPVDVLATHLHWTDAGDAIRGHQLANLLGWSDGRGDGTPRLLLGDFNAPPDADSLADVRERFDDAWRVRHPGTAPTTLNPAFFERHAHIDHVFVERGRFEVIDAEVVLDAADDAGTWPSDHFGVRARLRLAPAPR